MPIGASTSAADLGLVGVLNHSAIRDPAYGSAAIVAKVSDRIVFLLQQETTSPYFRHFPAVSALPPTALEKRFSDEFSPAWLEVSTQRALRVCQQAPSYDSSCPTYASFQVVPAQLRLEDSTPAPLSVYGFLAGEWVLAYSPTSSAATSRNCPVTLTSLEQTVATIVTNDVTGAQVVAAAGPGRTSITVSVQGVPRLVVPVTVTGVED